MSWLGPLDQRAAQAEALRREPLGEEAKEYIRLTAAEARKHGLEVLASVIRGLAEQYGRRVYDIGRIARIYKWQR